MNLRTALQAKFEARTARVGVVGVGYVGLPLAVALAEAGFQVTAVDTNPDKVRDLQAGRSYVGDVADSTLQPLVAAGRLHATTQYAGLTGADAISICVPTPLHKTKDPDISHILHAVMQLAAIGCAGKLIVLESTAYPGATEEIILPRLAANGAEVGRDFFLAFSPERTDPGRRDYTLHTTPKVIGGLTPACLEVAQALYRTIVAQLVSVSGTATAEMVKLLENTFRAVNIALVNEVALMCDRLGLDVWEVVDAAATKPYGFMPFYPGPGLGGHCIPVDPHYLSWKLRTLNYTARFIELAAEINSHMPDEVVGRMVDALNADRKAVNGSRILLLGVAYKANVSDVRESPALDIILLLAARGAVLSYHDPHVPELALEGLPHLQSVPLTAETLQAADCVLVVTDHAAFDWPWIARHAGLIVDTRNALRGVTGENGRIVRL